MKVLEVITGLSSGGAERFVVDLCNQMVEDGHEVYLLVMKDFNVGNYDFYKKDLSESVHIQSLGLNKFGVSTFYSLYKAIKDIPCDIVHMHLDPPFFGILSYIFDRKKKYIVTSHNQAESEREEKMRFYVKQFCFKLGLFEQVAISHQNATSITTVYGKQPIETIYNGRAFTPLSGRNEEVITEIEKFKKTLGTLIFCIIARCTKQKNIPRLVRVFNQLHQQGFDFELLVIGSGYNQPEYKKCIENASSHIHFLGECHNVVDYLSCSDFFTLSSDYEGMPITLIEALACKCIPVGTPVSGFNDVITDGVNGFIAKDFSDNAYLDALKRAITYRDKINKNDLYSLYIKEFSIQSCASKYETLFSKLLEKENLK